MCRVGCIGAGASERESVGCLQAGDAMLLPQIQQARATAEGLLRIALPGKQALDQNGAAGPHRDGPRGRCIGVPVGHLAMRRGHVYINYGAPTLEGRSRHG